LLRAVGCYLGVPGVRLGYTGVALGGPDFRLGCQNQPKRK
jgi:hypothetical protein